MVVVVGGWVCGDEMMGVAVHGRPIDEFVTPTSEMIQPYT